MKLHETVVRRLAQMYDTWGGHREDKKLVAELAKLDLTVYHRQDGVDIIVLTADVEAALKSK